MSVRNMMNQANRKAISSERADNLNIKEQLGKDFIP